MKRNLVFKKIVVENEITKTLLKVVPVDIPDNTVDGSWILISACDEIESVKETKKPKSTKSKSSKKEEPKEQERKILVHGDKYDSPISGTARLIRSGDEIIIAKRKGNTTYNRNDSNSVCISDELKCKFFAVCREIGAVDWRISHKEYPSQFTKWSAIIDEKYIEGINQVNSQNGF